ncbi:hypothetical protein CHN50_04915 [Priestia aryabhattai]|uniref:hypothetical protein n=1 Tax=Priestia TaxID=2800373 RepID=UPI000BA139F6|nr:hypothetical protein [Priestia flexa]MDT2046358.1 hypothetical protein [Priestia flexa]OZT13909.1 hypothetical protein CHN50_04915 [Priestia aryabhattai]USY53622.1 hypothetical protein NIZ91_12740 [Bacillus sp. 1780r2a1]
MVYFILVLIAAIEIIVLGINRSVFANIPLVEFYIVPLIIVIAVAILLSRRPNRMMRIARQGFFTAAIIVLVFVPVIYTNNLPLYSYKEAKDILAQREQLLLSQFMEGDKVYEASGPQNSQRRHYLLTVARGEQVLKYAFDPFSGGFELISRGDKQ